MRLVVGDWPTLGIDPVWSSFLRYVHSSEGWRGDEASFDPNLTVDQFRMIGNANKIYEGFPDQRWHSLVEASRGYQPASE